MAVLANPYTLQLDVVHMVFVSAFLSFFIGLTVHLLTKWHLSGKYVSKELFIEKLDQLLASHQADMKELMAHCELAREKCAVSQMRTDILEIKAIQRERTRQLRRHNDHNERLWRLALTALQVPVDRQNDLLACFDEQRPPDSRTRNNDFGYEAGEPMTAEGL